MGIKEIISKPIFKKWWFWVIIAFIVLGAIGSATKDNSGTTDVVDNSSTGETFNEDFDSLCDTITSTYSSIGTISCQGETTWETNHESSPDAFPYEYRDINVDFGDEIAYEIKVVVSPEDMDYFRENYTCSEIYLGDGSCIVDEAKTNILYAIIFYNENNQEEIIKLSDALKAILEQ